MQKKEWEKPQFDCLDVVYTLSGADWGWTEQEAYDQWGYANGGQYKTKQELLDAIAKCGYAGYINS